MDCCWDSTCECMLASRSMCLVVGDSDSGVQQVHFLYNAHTRRVRRMRDAIRDGVAARGSKLKLIWERRAENKAAAAEANKGNRQQRR